MSQDMKTPKLSRNLPQFRSTALVAVGSNTSLGGKPLFSTIDRALDILAGKAGVIRSVSRYFSTPAFPAGSGPDFVNAAFEWSADLSARDMMTVLHDVEQELGRVRRERWGARTIDLDLIAVGDTIHPDIATYQHWMDLPLADQQAKAPGELILPHPRVQDRGFVLVPLCDIAPDWRHPVLNKTAQELRDALPQEELESVKPLENRAEQP